MKLNERLKRGYDGESYPVAVYLYSLGAALEKEAVTRVKRLRIASLLNKGGTTHLRPLTVLFLLKGE